MLPKQPRTVRASVMTTNLHQTLNDIVSILHMESEAGERYAVEIHVTGPLTVEEAVTALWEKRRAVQIPVT